MIPHFRTYKHYWQPEIADKGTGNQMSRKKNWPKLILLPITTLYVVFSFFFCWNIGAFMILSFSSIKKKYSTPNFFFI